MTIMEMYYCRIEERKTGLDIKNVKLCGVKEWFKDGVRCMVFFYKTNCFSGTLQSSEEGEVFWASATRSQAVKSLRTVLVY